MSELPRQTPSGHVIFCDDIRDEASGKKIYLGIYVNGIVVFSEAPAVLPKLALAIYYFERPGESEDDVSIEVIMPGQDMPTVSLPLPTREFRNQPLPKDGIDDPIHGMIVALNIEPCELRQPGRILVIARRGELTTRLGSTLVEFKPPQQGDGLPPIASPPPFG